MSDIQSQKPSLPERATLVVSIGVVLTLLVFLGWHGFTTARVSEEKAAPMATARIIASRISHTGEQWAVPIEVENTGNVPLEAIHVLVEMPDKEGKKAETELDFPYLAEGAKDNAYVIAERDPAKGKSAVRVQSFQTQQDARGY
jgi:uncharacterized protein (TIGR02588 family)